VRAADGRASLSPLRFAKSGPTGSRTRAAPIKSRAYGLTNTLGPKRGIASRGSKLAQGPSPARNEPMKSAALAFLSLLGAIVPAMAKPYDLPSEHLTVSASDEWKVTTESDELFGVTNANNDSFTITVNSVGRPVDIQQSTILGDVKAKLTGKGMEILRDGQLTFHNRKAAAVLAKMTHLGYTFYLYEILMIQGGDLVSFILVGDSDPSQQPQFQAILDSVSFDASSPSNSASDASAGTPK